MRRVTEGEQPEPDDDLEEILMPTDRADPVSGLRTELHGQAAVLPPEESER